MRRTTIRLDDHILAAAKAEAARSGSSLTALVEDALRQLLARRAHDSRARTPLPVDSGEGLLPGVSLDRSAALRDLMEGLDESTAEL